MTTKEFIDKWGTCLTSIYIRNACEILQTNIKNANAVIRLRQMADDLQAMLETEKTNNKEKGQ